MIGSNTNDNSVYLEAFDASGSGSATQFLLTGANAQPVPSFSVNRLTIHSPKTEHHEGRAERVIPLFPEIRTHLQAVV